VAEKPIVFSGWKVRAIYAGADVTRRLMNPQPRLLLRSEQCSATGNAEVQPVQPRYHKGDILYVKEAWRTFEIYDGLKPSELLGQTPTPSISYMERPGNPSIHWGRYRHARFMCKWMSRLWLRVTEEPTPERVRDITEAEAIREGVEPMIDGLSYTHTTSFAHVWVTIHGLDSWERDWVWRYAFERMEAPDA